VVNRVAEKMAKKQGMDAGAIRAVEIVSTRSFQPGEQLTNVVVGRVDPKHASTCLTVFADLLPLGQFNLDHLKRIKRTVQADDEGRKVITLEVVVCSESHFTQVPDPVKAQLLNHFEVKAVPKYAPMLQAGTNGNHF
jgi:hypothetical protein